MKELVGNEWTVGKIIGNKKNQSGKKSIIDVWRSKKLALHT